MATTDWLNMHSNNSLKNLVAGYLDHTPILLETEVSSFIYRRKQFRFENSWLVEPELELLLWIAGQKMIMNQC